MKSLKRLNTTIAVVFWKPETVLGVVVSFTKAVEPALAVTAPAPSIERKTVVSQ